MIGATGTQRITVPASIAGAIEKTSLPAPYDTQPSESAIEPSPATLGLVKSQVNALLTSSPSFHCLGQGEKKELSENLIKIAAYGAELIRDDWYQSEKIGQRPVVRKREVIEAPIAGAQATTDDGFQTSAANQIGRVTKDTLNAIAFPTFVADLIKGSFNAIVQSSIQQMEAYIKLIENVSKTVDQFMNDNISDNQAKDYLAQSYPDHITVQGGNAVPRDGADEKPPPNWQRDLNLSQNVGLDESSIEEILIPAARRKLAQSRHQMLSTMVMMGINRIVVTGGKIRATMGFHIDTTDKLHQEKATDFDLRVAAAGSFGFGPWSASLSTSVSYVTSSRQKSDSEMNVEADLTGEVEIHFKSDYFPLNRFVNNAAIGQIQSHTAVPENNAPGANAVSEPFAEPPAVGGQVGRYTSPRPKLQRQDETLLPKIGTPLQPARTPDKVVKPDDIHPVRKEEEKKEEKPEEKKAEETKPEEKKEETKVEAEKGGDAKVDKPVEEKAPEKEGETSPTKEESPKAEEKPAEGSGDTAKTDEGSPKQDGIKEKAQKAIGEVGGTVKQAVGEKAGDFVKDVIGNIGK